MSLKSQGKITEKELKYFTYEYQKATNLGKMYLLPKIHPKENIENAYLKYFQTHELIISNWAVYVFVTRYYTLWTKVFSFW